MMTESDLDSEPILIVIRGVPSDNPESTMRALHCPADYLSAFGELTNNSESKWCVSLTISALLDDPAVLIEGVLFRARYLGSTQLACEGQPTKSTRMCQAEEAVSRIKVRLLYDDDDDDDDDGDDNYYIVV